MVGALATVTACGSDAGDPDFARSPSSIPSASATAPSSSASAAPSDSSGSRAPGNEQPTSYTAQSPSPSAHTTPSRTSFSEPAAASGARRVCSTTQLKVSLGRMDMGAGNVYLPLVFTNKRSTICTLTGYPGVSLLDSTGSPIGDPATRRGTSHAPVSLPPGGSAFTGLHTLNEGITDTPCRRAAERIRVFPPDSFDAKRTSARSFRVCGGVFEVEAVRSGTG